MLRLKLATRNTPENAVIAVDDIGAIGYLSEREIFDLNGLVSPEMWAAFDTPFISLERNQLATRIISQKAPTHMAIFPLWHFEIATNGVVSAEIARFTTETNTIIGEQEAIIYAVEWPYISQATPQNTVEATFGDAIQLLGYDLQQADGVLNLRLYWQTLAEMSDNYDLFVHVLNENGDLIAQTDGQPLNFLTPTSIWQPGDIVADPRTVLLPEDAGDIQLSIGWYLRETGARLPVTPTMPNDALLLKP